MYLFSHSSPTLICCMFPATQTPTLKILIGRRFELPRYEGPFWESYGIVQVL